MAVAVRADLSPGARHYGWAGQGEKGKGGRGGPRCEEEETTEGNKSGRGECSTLKGTVG